MLQIRTDYSTYTANIPADQSEKLFRKIVADIIAMDEFGASRSIINEYLPESDALQEDIPEAEPEHKAVPKQPKSPEAHPDVTPQHDPVMEPKPIGRKYGGFLYIKCQHCGEVKAFCAKIPTDTYRCKKCGKSTDIGDLSHVNVDCECGRHTHYMTNMQEFLFDINCIDCGSPVAVKWDKKRKSYNTIE